VDVDPGGDGVEAFAAMYVREIDGVQVQKDELFQVYSRWIEAHDIDGTNQVWFGRKLAYTIDQESDRVRKDGENVNTYVGIDLTENGYEILE
jgi:hypothetical protein